MVDAPTADNDVCVCVCVRERVYFVLFFTFNYLQIGPRPYPVIYAVTNPIRGHKVVRRSMGHMFRFFFEPATQTNRDSNSDKLLVRYNHLRFISM